MTEPKQTNRNSQIETLVPRGTIKNEKEKIRGKKIKGRKLKTQIEHCALLKKSERKLKDKRTKIDFSCKYTKYTSLSWLQGDDLLIRILLFGLIRKFPSYLVNGTFLNSATSCRTVPYNQTLLKNGLS